MCVCPRWLKGSLPHWLAAAMSQPLWDCHYLQYEGRERRGEREGGEGGMREKGGEGGTREKGGEGGGRGRGEREGGEERRVE